MDKYCTINMKTVAALRQTYDVRAASVKDKSKQSVNRKAGNDAKGPSSTKKISQDTRDTNMKTIKQDLSFTTKRAEYKATYKHQHHGGCGSVFAGYHRADNLTVIIKRVSKQSINSKAGNDGEEPSRTKSRDTNMKTIKQKQRDLSLCTKRAEYKAKYKQQHHLSQGGCGSVFTGYRRADDLPVAIKHVSKQSINSKAGNDGERPSRTKKKSRDTNMKTITQKQRDIYARTAKFKAKYEQQHQLGQGGCGSVFAGYRRADNLAVAIKHVPKDKVYCKAVDRDGREVSVEVVVMLKLAAGRVGSVGTSAPVSLLDWYDLGQELILVLERPVPCVDLQSYTELRGGCLQEEEAKIILKQLLEAAMELQKRHIFHRDIKVQNILIETGSDVPRVRIIDFGMSCFFTKTSTYQVFCGTPAHVPPEFFSHYTYRAGPTTVWQLGVVLYNTLHVTPFKTTRFLRGEVEISCELSTYCLDFLRVSLSIAPEHRPTLDQLRLHPWLR